MAAPCILLFPHLRLADRRPPIEDMLASRILEDCGGAPDDAPGGRRGVPKCFRRIEQWPLECAARCWSCGGACEEPPRFVPTYLTRQGWGEVEMGVHGVMCRFVCAARFILDRVPGVTAQHRAQSLLLEACAAFADGRRPLVIAAAPPRERLEEFGGDLSRAEYARIADGLERELGVLSKNEIRVRAAAFEALVAPESASSQLSQYKEKVAELGLLR